MNKLLFTIPTLSHGGAERVMTNLANQFGEKGYDITLLVEEKADDEYPVNKYVKKKYLPYISPKIPILHNIRLLAELRKAIKKESPDIAMSFLDRYNLYFQLSTLGLKNIKRFSSVRNTFEVECSNPKKAFLVRRLYPKADGIILQTNDIKKRFEDEKIDLKSCVIPNQVAPQFFDKAFIGERRNIVSVGRLDSQKNQELLIRAFSKIADKTDGNLIIYGQGELKNKLNSLISELKLEGRVILGGLIEDVPNTIIGSKLFVLSSDFEGSPNALLEAIALGIPSISTDCPCGGPKEIIEDGKNGFLVPVGNIDSLAEKMLYVLSLSDSELKCISENAKKSADRYRPEKIFKQWKDFLIGEE